MTESDLHIEFDYHPDTGIYDFRIKVGNNDLTLQMDGEQFESITNSMIKLVKDVNLMQAINYQKRVEETNYPLLDDDR